MIYRGFSFSQYKMDTTSRSAIWNLKRKGLVRAPDSPDSPDSRAFLLATLLISHNIDTKQGIISIRVTLSTSNPTRPSQELTLMLPPKSVKNCSWTPKSDDHLCPSRLLSKVPRHGADASSISTLSLELNTTATVFVPLKLEPHTEDILDFHALEKISQSKTLYVHFGKDQITKEEIHPLQIFLGALQENSVEALCLDHKRHGLIEGHLHILRQAPLPPPYSEKPVSEQEEQVGLPAYRAESSEQMVAKRRNAPLSILPDDERQERLLFLSSQPLVSPTEVNTPSTDSLSTSSLSPPPIRPTIFTRVSAPGRAEVNKLTGLERQLHGVPDDTIRNLLTRSGHRHLLAKPDVVDSDLSYASEKASFAKVGMNDCPSIEDYVDAMVERRLQSHVNKIVDENCHLLYDLLGEHEREFRNEIDDFKSELRNATDGYISEIEETRQESMGQLEAKSQQCLDYIQDQGVASKEEKTAKLKLNLTRRRQLYGFRLASFKRQYLRQVYTKRRLRG